MILEVVDYASEVVLVFVREFHLLAYITDAYLMLHNSIGADQRRAKSRLLQAPVIFDFMNVLQSVLTHRFIQLTYD